MAYLDAFRTQYRWTALCARGLCFLSGSNFPGALSLWLESTLAARPLALFVSDLDQRPGFGMVCSGGQLMDEHSCRLCHSERQGRRHRSIAGFAQSSDPI